MSKILKAVKVFALVIVGNMIAQAIFIGSIATYVNFLRYVSYWVAYPSLRLELEEYAPNTAKLTKKLIENYDTLLALYDEVP